MQEFQLKHSSLHLGRRAMLVAALAILVIGSGGFVAAGGVELIRNWFVTIEVDGRVIDVREEAVTVETKGDTVTVSLEGGELDTEVEASTVTVHLSTEPPEDDE